MNKKKIKFFIKKDYNQNIFNFDKFIFYKYYSFVLVN